MFLHAREADMVNWGGFTSDDMIDFVILSDALDAWKEKSHEAQTQNTPSA